MNFTIEEFLVKKKLEAYDELLNSKKYPRTKKDQLPKKFWNHLTIRFKEINQITSIGSLI